MEKRPIIFAFEHQILPEFALSNNPLLCQWLEQPNNLIIRNQIIELTAEFVSTQLDLNDSCDVVNELRLLYEHVKMKLFILDKKEFFVINLPPPVAALEAYAIVIVHLTKIQRIPHIPSQFIHFFTLEFAEGLQKPMLCEWVITKQRRNYGFVTLPTSLHAIAELIRVTLEKNFRKQQFQPHTELTYKDQTGANVENVPQWFNGKEVDSLDSLLSLFEFDEMRYPGRYAYRGQIMRSPMIVLEKENDYVAVEGLFPADFRFMVEKMQHQPTPEEITAIREKGRDKRDEFTNQIFDLAQRGDDRLTWIAKLINANESEIQQLFDPAVQAESKENYSISIEEALKKNIARQFPSLLGLFGRYDQWLYRACWSLAQHYGLATNLLDLTYDPRVAAWFATNQWDLCRAPPSEGKGVIYRFDLIGLKVLLDKFSLLHTRESLQEGILPPPRMFVVRIDSIPPSVAFRPSAQRGLSLYGFDRPIIIQSAFFSGVVEIFMFPHESPYESEKINRDVIQSMNDPFLNIINLFSTQNRTVL